eukprot:CAMPEP_0183746814 /NCGR_PEP_ID=MMETSP0737-20130205/66948_1 /TAXON_ID=385413 /ORGANISM="Thalassiosira miniscula, Strain CCMP1093" /LENGTH=637 /DNA_ID=CAMNT_0025982519 /DNA_START=35 /DNA_END=1948 /DNA_ORIENTATION=+
MKLLIASILVLPLASSETVLEKNPQECIDPADYDADTDFFPEKFVPHGTTDLLTVEYHKTYKIITNKFEDKSYLLYQCGTEPPSPDVAGENHLVLPVPHTGGIAITQTPQIAPMELLAKRSDIKAYIGNPGLISSPCLKHMIGDDSIQVIQFPDDQYNTTLLYGAARDYVAENPDTIVFAGPNGNVDADRHMGIAASQEGTAVAIFDWLGMYAALFNLEGTANQIISDTESRYECSASNAAALTADVQEDEKPKILWAQYFDGLGWSVRSCPTWDTAYYCEYAHHCGAEIIERPEGVGSATYWGDTAYWYLTDEEFLEVGKDAPLWIYPSQTFGSLYASKRDMLDQFQSVQDKNVYDTQGQGPHGWYEQRLAEYDVVALDMCTLVGRNNPESVHRIRWFRNFFDEPIGGMGACDAPDEIDLAYVPAEAVCTPLAAESVTDAPDDTSAEEETDELDDTDQADTSAEEETDELEGTDQADASAEEETDELEGTDQADASAEEETDELEGTDQADASAEEETDELEGTDQADASAEEETDELEGTDQADASAEEETDELDDTDQADETDATDETNEVDETDATDNTDQGDEIDATDETNEVDESDEEDEVASFDDENGADSMTAGFAVTIVASVIATIIA